MRKILSCAAVLSAAFLWACGDSDSNVIGDGTGGSAASGDGGSPSEGPNGSGGGSSTPGSGGSASGGASSGGSGSGGEASGGASSGGSGSGGESPGGSCADSAPPVQCVNNSGGEFRVCFENACGKAGETVDIDVYVLGPTGCESVTNIEADIMNGVLPLANPKPGCIQREEVGSVVDWAATSEPGCPELLVGTKIDTIELTIPASTSPQDLVLATTGSVRTLDGDCGALGSGGVISSVVLAPTVRVVP